MKQPDAILIYDDLCPLCTWYTKLFVRFGLLPANGRVAFSNAPSSLLSMIQLDKGKNEIPLVHFPSNKVFYGIDAMLMVLSQKMPIINTIGQFPPIKWLLKKLYKLVSFNRKVIVAQKCGKGQFDCSPEFNVRYRILFLAIFLVFNSAMLYPIHFGLLNRLSFYHLSFFELETAHLLFVFCNCALSFFLPFERQLEYLGQVNMLALCTILLCIPVLIPCTLVSVGEILIAFWLLLVLAFVVKEYFRRMRYAGILTNHQIIARANFICLGAFLYYLFI